MNFFSKKGLTKNVMGESRKRYLDNRQNTPTILFTDILKQV